MPAILQRLFPDPVRSVDPVDAYGRMLWEGTHRPAVRLNMIASTDGAAALKDRTAGLGGGADHTVFATLRSLTDLILVGAGTVRAESYGPARLDEETRTRRRGWGLAPVPTIAVLTRSCRLDWDAPFFTQAEQRPLVLTTTSADAAERKAAAAVAEVIVAGDATVDLHLALQALSDRGVNNVLAEGGPRVSAQLAAADLLDELCLTLSPLVVAGPAPRILNGPELGRPLTLELNHVLESEGYLFLRYGRQSPPGAARAR